MFGIRTTLKFGAIVFGLSALLLLITPEFFLDLLLLDSSSAALVWSMRMIGITLVALAGNMWVNSTNPDDSSVRTVGMVMALAATALGALTMVIPTELGWFAYVYAAVGFAFGANYLLCLMLKKYS
jgi:hypothetical protein